MTSVPSTGRTIVRSKETEKSITAAPVDKTLTNVEKSSVDTKREDVKIEKDPRASLTKKDVTDSEVVSKIEFGTDKNVNGKSKELSEGSGSKKKKKEEEKKKKEEEKKKEEKKEEGEEKEKEEKGKTATNISDQVFEKITLEDLLDQPIVPICKPSKIPIHQKPDPNRPVNVAVPRKRAPFPPPALHVRPLVLATHLVPSLPISLFEILAEVIEVATGKPVVLLHEHRPDRPVAKDITDIAILPASGDWKDGDFLPVSFVFAHRLNKDNSPSIYADIVLASDRASHVQNVLDLRGQRCALPDRHNSIGAAMLFLNYLHIKGEGPSFFGNTLDSGSQLAALQMIAGKQAEVGILEAPVITCHKKSLPGVESLHILSSLGPLPPYLIMVNKFLSETIRDQILTYLLKIEEKEDWIERLSPYGIVGFAKNSSDFYDLNEIKPVVTSVPYY